MHSSFEVVDVIGATSNSMDNIHNDVKYKMAAIVGGLCMEGLWRGVSVSL